jgi:hypothetical protein
MSVNCHCRDCQRATGSAYSTDMVIPILAWKLLVGEPKFYDVKADSGNNVSRGFCIGCGSPLFAKESAAPDIIVIAASSLDDPSRYQPTGDLWTSSAQRWDHMNPDLEKFETQP